MDNTELISPWESSTIRAAVKGAITTLVALLLRIFGGTYDMGFISDIVNYSGDILLYGVNLYWYYEAAKGRINATQRIGVNK